MLFMQLSSLDTDSSLRHRTQNMQLHRDTPGGSSNDSRQDGALAGSRGIRSTRAHHMSKAALAAAAAVAGGLYVLYQREFSRRQQDEVSEAFEDATDHPLHLVATDMDGTFLSPAVAVTDGHANGYLSGRSIAAAQSLTASGVLFCIATGRPAPALQEHVAALGLSLPCICFNGAAVLRMHADGRPPDALWTRPLDAGAVAAVLEFANAEGLCVSYSLLDHAVAACAGASQRALLDEYMRLEGVTQRVVSSSAELASLPPPLKMVRPHALRLAMLESRLHRRRVSVLPAPARAPYLHLSRISPGISPAPPPACPARCCSRPRPTRARRARARRSARARTWWRRRCMWSSSRQEWTRRAAHLPPPFRPPLVTRALPSSPPPKGQRRLPPLRARPSPQLTSRSRLPLLSGHGPRLAVRARGPPHLARARLR